MENNMQQFGTEKRVDTGKSVLIFQCFVPESFDEKELDVVVDCMDHMGVLAGLKSTKKKESKSTQGSKNGTPD